MNRVWYELRIGDMSSSHASKTEAEEKLADMKRGYPDNEYMSEDNHKYWKKASKGAVIYRVKQTAVRV